MKVLKMVPIGAGLLALGLSLCSVTPSPASARDEDSGTRYERKLIRVAQDDRDSDRDSDSGYLGVQVQRLTAALRRAKGIPESTEGTLVSNVEDQSPADEAGIKRGDVILEVNHESTPGPNDLVQTVSALRPGKRVPVLIWRNGVTRTLTLTVGSRPAGSEMPPMPNWSGPGDRGMPDDGRMPLMRRNREEIQNQIRDLQEQLARLRNEVQELRSELRQMDRGDRDRGYDRNRNDDRDPDNNRDD